MRPFAYAAAQRDQAEAVELVTSTDGATYLAGGTNLVDLMKLGATRPTMLVDVGGLGFDTVDELDDGGLRIGGTARNSDVAGHPAVPAGVIRCWRWPCWRARSWAGAQHGDDRREPAAAHPVRLLPGRRASRATSVHRGRVARHTMGITATCR